MVCHRCHLASIVTRPSVYDDMIMNDNDIVIKYVMVWICFAYITYTVYSSCLHTVLHGYKFTNHNNWHLFPKRQDGGREGGREREWEREREIEREGERDRNKKKVAFGARTHCWRWFAVLRLTQYLYIYIYTYFCVYVVLLSSWFVVVSSNYHVYCSTHQRKNVYMHLFLMYM